MWFRSWFSHLPPPGRPWACSLHQPYWEVKALWCSSARGFAVTCWLAQAAADWAVPGPPPLIPPNPPSHTQTHCSPSTAYTWLSPEGPPHSHWWILKPRSAGKPPTCVITYLTLKSAWDASLCGELPSLPGFAPRPVPGQGWVLWVQRSVGSLPRCSQATDRDSLESK